MRALHSDVRLSARASVTTRYLDLLLQFTLLAAMIAAWALMLPGAIRETVEGGSEIFAGWLLVAFLAGAPTFYCLLYGWYFPRQERGMPPLQRVRASLKWATERIAPYLRRRVRVRLVAGSAAVLGSLFLATSVEACRPNPTGVQILLKGEKWVGAWLLNSDILATLARVQYGVTLLVAIVSLGFVLRGLLRSQVLVRPRFASTLLFLSAAASLFAISDYCFAWVYLAAENSGRWRWLSVGAWCLYWTIPLALWLRYGRSDHRAKRWGTYRHELYFLYAPLWAYACLTLPFILPEAPGLVLYLAGTQLLWSAYADLAGEGGRLVDMPRPPALAKPADGSG